METEPRILIVDDNPAIHEDFRKILRPPSATGAAVAALEDELFGAARSVESGILVQVESAYRGDRGVEMVAAAKTAGAPFMLAFVDVRMPEGPDGIQTITRMWEIDPDLQVVLCTAYSDYNWHDLSSAFRRSDGLLVVKKPFDPIEVLQLTYALTRKWELEREVENQVEALEKAVRQRTSALEAANAQLWKEIEARGRAESELKHAATHDVLTGLPNRYLLQDRIGAAITRARRHGFMAALLLIDLDHFKEVNDSCGHAAGDALLREVAVRFCGAVRESDTVARTGGDEFVILIEELAEPESAALIAARVLGCCVEPVSVAGHQVMASPSIGIALFPTDASDGDMLLKCADVAMYQSKTGGRGTYRFFNPEMLAGATERVRIREELGQALANNELALWYQPLVSVALGQITGMEALLRWQHPRHGMVSPAQFIPEAERSGLIVPIGRWVLDTACRQLAEWHRQGAEKVSVAVNVSARQLRNLDFPSVVRAAVEACQIEPHLLELEITESTAFEDVDLAQRALAELADIGVRLLIDDFGSGYSNLARLKSLPVHGLKVDGQFVRNVAEDSRDAAIVTAIIAMAHSLGIDVVAEGVETEEQLTVLRTRCWRQESTPARDRLQGYYLGRPAPADAATALLARQQNGPASSA